jgi:hypothetical protein
MRQPQTSRAHQSRARQSAGTFVRRIRNNLVNLLNARRPRALPTLILLLGLCAGPTAFAETITIRPIADTALFGDDPTNNLGAELTIPIGATDAFTGKTNRGLIKFDVAPAMPSNAIVTSVTLTMTVMQVPGQGQVNSMFGLRRMLRNWGEGNKRNVAGPGSNGALATAGESTWLYRLYPDAFWSVPGGGAGVDFVAAFSATNFIRGLGSYTFNSTPELVADAQAWLNNPSSNFGWLIRSESEGSALTNRRFASREDTNNAPRLVIEFTTSGGLRIDSIKRSGTNVQLQFMAEAGKSYGVEVRNSMTVGSWQTLTNIAAQPNPATVTVSDPITAAQQYYRLRSP